jgi:mono/diheme cytochrome c family protein
MRKLVLAALALSLAGSALAVEARQLYGNKCNACHGKDGKGTSVGQKMGVPDLTALQGTEGEIAASITNGKGKMAAYKDKLTAEEIGALAKFVKGGLK